MNLRRSAPKRNVRKSVQVPRGKQRLKTSPNWEQVPPQTKTQAHRIPTDEGVGNGGIPPLRRAQKPPAAAQGPQRTNTPPSAGANGITSLGHPQKQPGVSQMPPRTNMPQRNPGHSNSNSANRQQKPRPRKAANGAERQPVALPQAPPTPILTLTPPVQAVKSQRLTTDCSQLTERAEDGDHNSVRSILAANANNLDSEELARVLMVACEGGHEQVCIILLNAGANVNHVSETSNSPLLNATGSGNEALVNELLRRDANVHQVNEFSETALLIAAKFGYTQIVKMLLSAGAGAADDMSESTPTQVLQPTPLILAAANGHASTCQTLLAHGANPSAYTAQKSPLICAALAGHAGVVQILLNAGADVQHENDFKESALSYAKSGKHQEIVTMLLTSGALEPLRPKKKKTPPRRGKMVERKKKGK